MPTPIPTVKDVRSARKQAQSTVSATVGIVKTPLLAVLGATDAAVQAVTDAVGKARSEAEGRAKDRQARLQSALEDLQARLSELPQEISELRNRIEPAELRKLADAYADVAQKAYSSLVGRGEEVFGEFRSQPRVKQAVGSVESSVDNAQGRLETVVRDVNKVADDLLARFARSSRSTGEKAARKTEKATKDLADQVKETSDEVAGKVAETGKDAASNTRSTTRKAANKAEAPRRPATRRNGTSKS